MVLNRKHRAGLQLAVHAASYLWIELKQEEVIKKRQVFLQNIMPSYTPCLIRNQKEAKQVSPKDVPSLSSDFTVYPELHKRFQCI